jgi:hypothetical protein
MQPEEKLKKVWTFVLLGLAMALVLGGVLSPFASPNPDGLESVAEKHGFAEKADSLQVYKGAPLPDYKVPGVKDDAKSTRLAGLVGTAAAFSVGLVAAYLLRTLARTRASKHKDQTIRT